MPTTRRTAVADPVDEVLPVEDVDPRRDALDALLQPPPSVLSDTSPPVAVRRPPALTGVRDAWTPDGDWYLVSADIYPRVIGDARLMARAGDVIRVPDDDRTHADLASGYLAPED